MAACHICLDELKQPISLPCGHIFCSECILQAVQAVKPATHLHTCPICRAMYNVAPVSANAVPPNLRPFVTPHLRRVFIDPPRQKQKAPVPEVASTPTSELSRLQAENSDLRTSRDMWRKRAEMHGATTIDLMNFAKALRDQAALLAREKKELQRRCHSLKRKLEDDESSRYQATFAQSFLRTSSITSTTSALDVSDSAIFESSLTPGASSPSHSDPSITVDASDHASAGPSSPSPRKRKKLRDSLV